MKLKAGLFSAAASVWMAGSVWAQGYVCAEGGAVPGAAAASESASLSAPRIAKWVVEKSKGGPVIVLGANPKVPVDAEVEKLLQQAGAKSVRGLVVTPELADKQEIFDAITACSAVWIRSGDQTRYVVGWRGTRTERAIRQVFDKGGVVGGSGAGCSVLGEVLYDGQGGSFLPREAMAVGPSDEVSLAADFLKLTPGVIFDPSFTDRARLPRLAMMLAVAGDKKLGAANLLGVGLDSRTALCIDPDLTAVVIGDGSVSMLARTEQTQSKLVAGAPPLLTNLSLTSLLDGDRYDLKNRKVIGGRASSAAAGIDGSARVPAQPLTVIGKDMAASRVGAAGWEVAADKDALVNGAVKIVKGDAKWPMAIVSPMTWESPQHDGNRFGAVLYAMATRPGSLGVLLDQNSFVTVDGSIVTCGAPAGRPPYATMIIDGLSATRFEVGKLKTTAAAAAPRQSVAMEGVKVHMLPPGWRYDLANSTPLEPVPAAEPKANPPAAATPPAPAAAQ